MNRPKDVQEYLDFLAELKDEAKKETPVNERIVGHMNATRASLIAMRDNPQASNEFILAWIHDSWQRH